jgi:hypothetical protein
LTADPLVPPSAREQRDGVVVTLAADRARVVPGERVWFTVTARNGRREAVLWRTGGCELRDDLAVDLTTTAIAGRAWDGVRGAFKRAILDGRQGSDPRLVRATPERLVGGGPGDCPATTVTQALGPGETVEIRLAWDGTYGSGTDAPPGRVAVRLAFPVLGGVRGEARALDPILVAVPLDVAPTQRQSTSPGQAIDAVLAEPRFTAWLDRHAGLAIETASIALESGTWVVRAGRDASSVTAGVDSASGEVQFVAP